MRMSLNVREGRRTRERELILDRIASLQGHFNAEDLTFALKRDRVSRATIYRSLELFVAQGLLQRVHLGERGAQYEIIHGRRPHAHLYCLGCGSLTDYPLPFLSHLPGRIEKQRRFATEHMLVRVCGYCQRCRARALRKNSKVRKKI